MDRNKLGLAALLGLLAVVATMGVAPATTEENPKPVLVTNDGAQPIPVDLQGSAGIHGTVEIENTPLAVRGDVNIANASVPVTGTVEVGNFPAVQDVRVTNEAEEPILHRGILFDPGEFVVADVPTNVVLTDLVGHGEGCRLEIHNASGDFEQLLTAFVYEDFSYHLQSGLQGPLTLFLYTADGCFGQVLWTGYEA